MISLVAASSVLLPFMVMVTAMVWSSLINSLTSPTRPALYPLLHESPYTRVILLLAALVETSPACFAPAHANAAFPWSSPWSLSWVRHALPCPCLAFPISMASLHVLHICTCSLALHTPTPHGAHAYASWCTRSINPTHSHTVPHSLTQSYTHDTLVNQSILYHFTPCLIAHHPSLPISKST
jgi:hypothetical protein